MTVFRFGDQNVIDSAGAYMQGELERLDKKLYEPKSKFTWGRDIDLRNDVAISDESTSFITSNYGAVPGLSSGNISWAKDPTTTAPAVSVDFEKTVHPLNLVAYNVSYTVIELAKSQAVNRPIDVQKYNAMKTKHQTDIDRMVYVGDSTVNATGMLNDKGVATENVGALSASATPNDFIDLVNNILNKSWKATNYVDIADRLLVSPEFFARLMTPLQNTNTNLYEWILQNNLARSQGETLSIEPVRWLSTKNGVFTTDTIVAYKKDPDYIRFPMVALQHTPVQYRDLAQTTTYYGLLGQVEIVRPEVMLYAALK